VAEKCYQINFILHKLILYVKLTQVPPPLMLMLVKCSLMVPVVQ